MLFLSYLLTTKPCILISTYLHFIILTFSPFHGAKKSHGILFNIRHVKGPPLFFTILNAKILFCSMAIYNSSDIFIKFLIHPQPIHLHFLHGWPAIFICVICQHLILFVWSSVIILRSAVPLPLLTGLDIPYYQIQEAHYPCQLKSLSIVHMCFSIFGIYTPWSSHRSPSFMYHPQPAPFNSYFTP